MSRSLQNLMALGDGVAAAGWPDGAKTDLSIALGMAEGDTYRVPQSDAASGAILPPSRVTANAFGRILSQIAGVARDGYAIAGHRLGWAEGQGMSAKAETAVIRAAKHLPTGATATVRLQDGRGR